MNKKSAKINKPEKNMNDLPVITGFWMNDKRGRLLSSCCPGNYCLSLRADFSNARHYEAMIMPPHDRDAVLDALLSMAHMIGKDPALAPQ